MPSVKPLLECVVNVSEGRDTDTLDDIARAINSVEHCYLLHRDVGHWAHRTVFTFAGRPESVYAAAFEVYRIAAARIARIAVKVRVIARKKGYDLPPGAA